MKTARNRYALRLFAPIADDYGVWSRLLSFGQDPRWRRTMVHRLGLSRGATVLDVAAGTGEVTRLLQRQGCRVVSLDQSPEMLAQAVQQGAAGIIARAEILPFPDRVFDGLTFTYLLRYVDDPGSCMLELARVVQPGGRIGMVEFGRPHGIWGSPWYFYTRVCLPLVGRCINRGWHKVGSFLGPSIEDFWQRFDRQSLVGHWQAAGLENIEWMQLSFGGGFIITGTKK